MAFTQSWLYSARKSSGYGAGMPYSTTAGRRHAVVLSAGTGGDAHGRLLRCFQLPAPIPVKRQHNLTVECSCRTALGVILNY